MTKNETSLVELDSESKQIAVVDRDKINVNSPRSGTKTKNMFAKPASFITQVNEDDVERQKEMAKIMGGCVDEQEESEHENLSSEQLPRDGDSVRNFSCWLCCGSSTKVDPHHMDKSAEDCPGHDADNQMVTSPESNKHWAVETKIMEEVDDVDEEADSKEEQYAIEISETEEYWLLDPVSVSDQGRKCLVLDLDETLVHSSFQPIECSFSLSIELDNMTYEVYVRKRPFVDKFIEECAKLYELVVFTASLSEYANPVIDTLDQKRLIKHRLFRESCVFHENQVYVKDLSRLGRNIKDCIIIDNSPFSYLFDPTNAIGCTSWFGDEEDTELRDLLPLLRGPLLGVNDVRTMLDARSQTCEWLINQYAIKNKNRESSTFE